MSKRKRIEDKIRRMLAVDDKSHKTINELRRELSAIESREVRNGEIVRRLLSDDQIIERLKLGAKERRMGMRK